MKVLDKEGTISAIIIGVVIILTAGWNYLFFMFLFLFLGILVTRYENEIKRSMGVYEHERGVENVLSNGLGPMIFAVLSTYVGPGPFICSIAAITSDTFASEIGVLGKGKPLYLGDLKPAKPGKSGAISVLGTIASAAGAMAIGVASIVLFNFSPNQALFVAFAGFMGSFADTIFGIFEEMGVGTKGTTNFICSIVGGLIGLLVRMIA
jgi:uncharacterized protein (TIGR00297 family)